MQRQEKQLGLVQSVMYCLNAGRVGEGGGGVCWVGGVVLLDQNEADNEEVNKRNGT